MRAKPRSTHSRHGVNLKLRGILLRRVWRSTPVSMLQTRCAVLDWVGDNQLWLTLASVTGVIAWVLWSNRHGMTQGETVEELIDDFEPDPDECRRRPARRRLR